MVTKVEITNPDSVFQLIDMLTTNTAEIDSINESLKQILRELKGYWSDTQQDAQSFAEQLKKDIENLAVVVECNNEFARIIENYAKKQQTTSSASVM